MQEATKFIADRIMGRFCLLLGVLWMFSLSVGAQDLTHQWHARCIERLYVHHDRTFYYAGETIRMAVYQTASDTLAGSKVVYIDVLDDRQEVVTQGKFPLSDGHGEACLSLPRGLPTGRYQLRAYTQWMRNFADEGLFKREITVYGSSEAAGIPREAKAEVRFYPEGGHLIDGVPGRVAFEITGEANDKRLFIVDEQGDTVRTATPRLHGKGIFTFLSRPHAKYTARLEGQDVEYTFPERMNQGFAMTVRPSGGLLRVQIVHNLPTDVAGKHSYSLVLHREGQLIVQTPVDVSLNEQLLNYPISELPAGVFTLSLIDENCRAWCERPVFVRFPEMLDLTATMDEAPCRTGTKVTLHLKSTDADGHPVGGRFSLAAVRPGLCDAAHRARLASYFFLGSEVRGEVKQMDDYWNPALPDALQRIELLLLTQGWRRYSLEEMVASDSSSASFPMEQGLTLGGTVRTLTDKQARGLTLQAVWRQDSLTQILHQELTEKHFLLTMFPFEGAAEVMLSVHDKKGNAYPVTADEPFPAPPGSFVPSPWAADTTDVTVDWKLSFPKLPQDMENELFDLGEITVTARKQDPVEKRRPYGESFVMHRMDVDADKSTGTVVDLLKRLPGVSVGTYQGRTYASILQFGSRSEATVLLDGYVMRDPDVAYQMDASRIERIEVLRGGNTALGGFNAGHGAIALYTRTSSEVSQTPRDICQWIGYTQQKEFYLPSEQDASFFDGAVWRHTYYWNADVRTDAVTGKAEISFLVNKSEQGEMLFHCEGLSDDGMVAGLIKESRIKEE